jgi:hypothetical protein
MMKYWMFQNNQVRGPYDPDDISQVPGFSGDALVCSDGRKGTSMGDWQRASMVPELSVALLKASQLAVSMKGGGSGAGFYSSLPPEPTLKDLAALGSLQEKVSLLDNSVTQLQDNLRLKETELLSVHRELEDKSRQAQELALKLGTVEEKLSSVGALQADLDKTTAAEHDLEATIQRQSQTIEELTQKMQVLQQDSADLKAKEAELEGLKSQLDEIKNRPSPSAGPSPFGPREGLQSAPSPGPSPFGPRDTLQPAAGEKLTPMMEPSPLPQASAPFGSRPLPLMGEAPTPSPVLDINISPSSPPLASAPPAAQLGGMPFSAPPMQPGPLPFSPLSAPPPSAFGPSTAPPPAPMSSEPEILSGPPKKEGGGKGVMVLLLLAGAIGVGVKLKLIPVNKIMRMLPIGMKKHGAEQAPLPPPPPPESIPKTPSPEELAEQAKKEAIDLVRNWPIEGGLKTVGQVLESESPQAGGLPPWMAEKIQDDMYQVNFYAKSPAGTKTYEFEASMGDKKVLAHNEPAAGLLTPSKPKKKGKGGKKAAPKAQDEHVLEDLLQNPNDMDNSTNGGPVSTDQPADDSGQPAGTAAPAKKKKKEPKRDVNKDLDELMGDEPAPAKKKAAPRKDESLDDLLVPGAAKGDLKEPEAAGNVAPPAGGDDSIAPAPAPKPAKKGAKPADAELLDDLLNP